MKIEKNLNWEPSFKNEVTIEEEQFTITINKNEVEILCDWDYGYGGRGSEMMFMNLDLLKSIIKELEES